MTETNIPFTQRLDRLEALHTLTGAERESVERIRKNNPVPAGAQDLIRVMSPSQRIMQIELNHCGEVFFVR